MGNSNNNAFIQYSYIKQINSNIYGQSKLYENPHTKTNYVQKIFYLNNEKEYENIQSNIQKIRSIKSPYVLKIHDNITTDEDTMCGNVINIQIFYEYIPSTLD